MYWCCCTTGEKFCLLESGNYQIHSVLKVGFGGQMILSGPLGGMTPWIHLCVNLPPFLSDMKNPCMWVCDLKGSLVRGWWGGGGGKLSHLSPQVVTPVPDIFPELTIKGHFMADCNKCFDRLKALWQLWHRTLSLQISCTYDTVSNSFNYPSQERPDHWQDPGVQPNDIHCTEWKLYQEIDNPVSGNAWRAKNQAPIKKTIIWLWVQILAHRLNSI